MLNLPFTTINNQPYNHLLNVKVYLYKKAGCLLTNIIYW